MLSRRRQIKEKRLTIKRYLSNKKYKRLQYKLKILGLIILLVCLIGFLLFMTGV